MADTLHGHGETIIVAPHSPNRPKGCTAMRTGLPPWIVLAALALLALAALAFALAAGSVGIRMGSAARALFSPAHDAGKGWRRGMRLPRRAATLAGGGLPLVAPAGVVIAAMSFARDATLLSRGELTAARLGVPVRGATLALHALAAFATAVAVTIAGSVGFVGLVIPHAVRLVIGNDQRWLMPAAVLAGGGLLTFADTVARTLVAPSQLPVGVLTALVGVPIFLWLLRRTGR